MTVAPRPFFVLSHGWGFDAGFWAAVADRLPPGDALALDCGYFGAPYAPELPVGRPLIAVGHSHGAMKLLLRGVGAPWAGFVAVNGFVRFSAADDFPGVRRRLIDQMVKRFDQDPATVLTDFRARCGVAAPGNENHGVAAPGNADLHAGSLHAGSLRAGLLSLRDDDARAQAAALTCPVLLLAGDADPIATADMTAASALAFRHAQTAWLAGGGHLSPLLAPDWCVGHLTAFAQQAAESGQ